MRCFEIFVARTAVSMNDEPFVPDEKLMCCLPDEANEILEPILDSYDQDPMWYFDGFWYPPLPWALVCLDREYAIGGHIATARPNGAGIQFAQYAREPNPVPEDFVPGVGVCVFSGKEGLEQSAVRSPVFMAAWEALKDCSSQKRWLAILDPLSRDWLNQIIPDDRERWFSNQSS